MQRPVVLEYDFIGKTAERCERELQVALAENPMPDINDLLQSDGGRSCQELSAQFENIYGLLNQISSDTHARRLHRLGWSGLVNTVTLYNPSLYFDFDLGCEDSEENEPGFVSEVKLVQDCPTLVRYMGVAPGETTDLNITGESAMYHGPHLVVEVPALDGIRTATTEYPPGFYIASIPFKEVIVDPTHNPKELN